MRKHNEFHEADVEAARDEGLELALFRERDTTPVSSNLEAYLAGVEFEDMLDNLIHFNTEPVEASEQDRSKRIENVPQVLKDFANNSYIFRMPAIDQKPAVSVEHLESPSIPESEIAPDLPSAVVDTSQQPAVTVRLLPASDQSISQDTQSQASKWCGVTRYTRLSPTLGALTITDHLVDETTSVFLFFSLSSS